MRHIVICCLSGYTKFFFSYYLLKEKLFKNKLLTIKCATFWFVDLFVCVFPWASAASHGCTAAYWLIVPPALDVATLANRCPRAYRRVLHSSGGSWNLWAGDRTGKCFLNADFHGTFRDLLHAANLRHGTHGFTFLPKEGVLRIFPPLKIRRLRPGLNPRTWVPVTSTLTPRTPTPLNV
jgi:hypothetical protein